MQYDAFPTKVIFFKHVHISRLMDQNAKSSNICSLSQNSSNSVGLIHCIETGLSSKQFSKVEFASRSVERKRFTASKQNCGETK